MTTELSTLSAQETERLALLEVKVSMGMRSFIEVGEALAEIRESRLYRATHAEFETYCIERFKMKRAHAYRLMNAADVVSPIGDKSAITTESQARELAKVEPAKREAVVAEAAKSTGGKITAASLKQAAQTIEMTPAPRAGRTADVGDADAIKAGAEYSYAEQYATMAINQLEKIPRKDPKRTESLERVVAWIKKQKP